MMHHIKISHNDRNDSLKCNGRFNVVLTDLSPQRHYRKAVWVGDELFYVVWEIKDGNFFCAVLHIGPKKKHSKFTYKFSLTTENGMKNISMLFQTQSVLKNMDNVFTPGDCVLLHYDTVTKFLNSENFLRCEFEISPIKTASGGDRNLAKHGASNDVNCDPDCLTDERDLLEQEVKRELLASYDNMSDGSRPHHSDNYRTGRGGRLGRGRGFGRISRAGRRGPESRAFQQRGKHLGSYSKLSRSLTDLRDEGLYAGEDTETLTLDKIRFIAHANRTKFYYSSSSPGKAKANYHKVKPSGLSATKCGPREHITKVSAVGKQQDNFQERVPTVMSHPSLSSVKSAPNEQASTQERTDVKSPINDSKVKFPLSEKVTDATVLGKSQCNFQASCPIVKSSALPTATSVNLTTAPTLSKPHDKTEAIYPNLDFVTVDDYPIIDLSPFDPLHDTVQASVSRGKVPTSASTVRNIPSRPRANVSPFTWLQNNQPNTATASEETWKCSLCGYLVPVKQTDRYYRLVDIAPPGTNWKCKLCDQWRP
jgi:hypothetical protein